MNRDFVISDTHFGDPNIIKYENRPFKDVDEMDKILIQNWNTVVRGEDTVFVLGDFSVYNDMVSIRNIINKLNGRKILIKGNHDVVSTYRYVENIGFDGAVDYPILYNDFFILSHEPVYINSNMPYANIYGHVHSNPSFNTISARSACVSVERINYTPIPIDSVIDIMRSKEREMVLNEQTHKKEET